MSNLHFEAKIHNPANDAAVKQGEVQDVQSSGVKVVKTRSEKRRQRLEKEMAKMRAISTDASQNQSPSQGAGEDGSENTAPDQETAATAKTGSRPVTKVVASEQMKKSLRRRLPKASYTTIHDNGVIKSWQAKVAFDGEKFEVEALNKKKAKAKIRALLTEHITSTPPQVRSFDTPTRTAAGKSIGKPTSLDKQAARARVTALRTRSVTSKSRLQAVVSKVSKDTLQGLTLREALTGQPEAAKGAEVKEPAAKAIGLGLPAYIRNSFKPAEKVETLNASSLEVNPLHVPQSPVPPLSYGLDRVLFNPGVYRLRDPRSRIYNFDPYLEKVVPAEEFDFAALKGYKVASTDPTLSNIAAENGLKYFTSTSSLTSVLMTFHFLISQWRPIDIGMLSKTFPGPDQTNFTTFTKAPTSIILKPKNGGYAIDKDDDGFGNTVLSLVGRSLEKLLTVPKKDFERYRRSKVTGKSAVETPDTEEAFHYTGIGKLLVRSQLDGYDPRLPGTGIFDIKTRAVLPVRMDGKGKLEVASSYEIKNDHGHFESFEREYHDMLRAPMLKYSMQARLGRMDGIFVAYHNVTRMFGFQYVSLPEIDRAIHGSTDTFRGDQELRASINILQDVLDRASTKFPDQVC